MDLKELINHHLPDKEAFYDLLIREKFFVPEFNCNIITIKFMDKVYRGEIYLPKMTEVHPIRISKPPSKKLLQAELVQILG